MDILLTGFFGEGNLGDDAILEGLMRSAPPGTRFRVTAGRHRLPAGPEPLPRRGPGSWIPFLRALRASDVLILTAGTLQDWSFEGVTFPALRLLAARWVGKPVSLWGAGLGPLRRASGRALAARVLRIPFTAWFRDGPSASLYQDLTGRPGRVGADWSWAIPGPATHDASEPLTTPGFVGDVGNPGGAAGAAGAKGAGTVVDTGSAWGAGRVGRVARSGEVLGLNLRPWFDADSRPVTRCAWPDDGPGLTGVSLQEAARRAFVDGPRTRVLLGLAARDEDRRLLERLFPHRPVRQPDSFRMLMDLCQGLTEGWAMRYHVLLAMLRMGLPVRPLVYDAKVADLCREAGLGTLPIGTFAPSARRPEATFTTRLTGRFEAMRHAFLDALGRSPLLSGHRPGFPPDLAHADPTPSLPDVPHRDTDPARPGN